MTRQARLVGLLLLSMAMACFTLWAALAVWYRLPFDEPYRMVAVGIAGVAGVGASVAVWTRRRSMALACFGFAATLLMAWWLTIQPPATADFAPDVARQTSVVLDGDRMTIRDFRNFAWRSEADFTERWEDRSFDLTALDSLDLFLSHWDNSGIAHMILSFGFQDGGRVAWSVEVRRQRGGGFSPLADLFKTNPLVLVAADERDVIGVRSNIRGEDVHRYALNLRRETIRMMLLEYAAEANRLKQRPAFYNTLTTNCTTAVFAMMRAVGATVPFDWRLILNGRLPDYAFDHGALEPGVPLADLKNRAPIGERARAAGLTATFSQAIRQH